MSGIETAVVSRLVKSEDLNHHGTLFAGRMAEWFIEACFIAACRAIGRPEEVVCLKLHGLEFTTPATKGDILTFRAFPARAGRSSLTVFCDVMKNKEPKPMIDGFVTFVKVDADGRPVPHGLILPAPKSEEEREIREAAEKLR